MTTQSMSFTPMFSAKQAAIFLGTSEGVLAVWRSNRKVDIPFYKVGASVKYKPEDLDAYLNANVHGGLQ